MIKQVHHSQVLDAHPKVNNHQPILYDTRSLSCLFTGWRFASFQGGMMNIRARALRVWVLHGLMR